MESLKKIPLPILVIALAVVSSATAYLAVTAFTPAIQEQMKAEVVEVTIAEGMRKEQIALEMANRLDWDNEQIEKFVEEDTALSRTGIEGNLAPGAYEIPKDATTYEVANTMRDAGQVLGEPFREKLSSNNWLTALKVASIVQREMQGREEDRFDIAESIWQKLDNDQPIESDATIAYMRDTMDVYGEGFCEGQEQSPECGKDWKLQFHVDAAREQQWWSEVTPEDRQTEWDAYNTYQVSELPERPISNPGRKAIEAAVTTRYTPDGEVIHSTEQ